MEFEIHINKLKKKDFEDPWCFESGMVMAHINHVHKDLDLWPKGSFCQILVESIQNTIVLEKKDEFQSL
jgi:hypothetical protein